MCMNCKAPVRTYVLNAVYIDCVKQATPIFLG